MVLLQQVVLDGAHAAQQQRGGVLTIAQHGRVALQFLQRAQGQHERRDQDDRDSDDTEAEPRRQFHEGQRDSWLLVAAR